MMQIQELPELAMNCQTSDLLLNSEQNLMLHKQNCNIPTESIGETFVDYVQKRNFENEKWTQSQHQIIFDPVKGVVFQATDNE